MLKISFEDGSDLYVDGAATVCTNKGPLLASQVFIGAYLRCGTMAFCLVTNTVSV